MRTSDVDILLVPGWTGSGADHWQSRWERSLRTARMVSQPDGDKPVKDAWISKIVEEVQASTRPVVLVAHSYGVAAVAHAAQSLTGTKLAGAYLVAPADLEESDEGPMLRGEFAPMPLARLPFPSVVIASSTDPHCTMERARVFADAWGATLVPAGDAGHINADSGHGPWPEGLMRFGLFLSQLNTTL